MSDDSSHRRHAIQVVASLPEDTADALLVLALARELVEGFLARPQVPASALDLDRGNVVSLSSASKGASF